MSNTRNIKVTYVACDGFRQSRSYKTLAGAQRFAQKWVGEAPGLGSWYAVSCDGVGRVSCDGATLAELFPKLSNEPAAVRNPCSCFNCGQWSED